MTHDEVLAKTDDFIKEKFSTETSGHDYWHMYRVRQLARRIADHETAVDLYVVELAALLHDIADWKFTGGDEEAGPRAARAWLEGLGVETVVIEHIEAIIRNMSFKGADAANELSTIEGKIVHDADKLDALGAIGIARVFAMSAMYKEVFHDPTVPVPSYASPEEYKAARSKAGRTVINHFHEKLLLLKDRMFTETGREIAEHRHRYMEQFVAEFLKEWDGEG